MSDGRWFDTAIGALRGALLVLCASLTIAPGAAAAGAQRNFASPEEAAMALVQALKANDREATLAVLGKDASSWISSGDAVADRAAVERFISAYDTKHQLVTKGSKATLMLGADDFPFAFPIVRAGKRWRFDTSTGKVEMLARRIGENELNAIKVLQAIVDAQLDYASADRNGDGVVSYAQKFVSSPGQKDGLYWQVEPGQPPSRRANCWPRRPAKASRPAAPSRRPTTAITTACSRARASMPPPARKTTWRAAGPSAASPSSPIRHSMPTPAS